MKEREEGKEGEDYTYSEYTKYLYKNTKEQSSAVFVTDRWFCLALKIPYKTVLLDK